MPALHRYAMGAPDELSQCPYIPNYAAPTVMFVRGAGTELWDREGKRYLDFVGGLAVQALGHAHPEVAEAIAEQARTLVQVSNYYATEHGHHVAATLDRLIRAGMGAAAPATAGKVFFCNSGAEANEFAFKLARKWAGHGRYGVITTYGSFHGRTLAALAACGQPHKHEPFAPMPEGFRHVARDDVAALTNAIDPSVAAIHLEPVQGEGGVFANSQPFMDAARALADERRLLFMLDEVQSGLCRTGRWFAFEHFSAAPDVVCLAKALGNGMPIAAVWARAEVADVLTAGDHGSTYGANALATAAARKVLEIMERDDLPNQAARLGERLAAGLTSLPRVVSVRGMGGLLAAELDGVASAEVAAAALDRGLLINPITPTAIRLTPPLTTPAANLDEALAVVAEVLR
jgi:predicted acetylornithine/succinylornithine family transaminase